MCVKIATRVLRAWQTIETISFEMSMNRGFILTVPSAFYVDIKS